MNAQHEKIRHIAYALWQKAGQPSGRDMEFWLNAEAQIKKRSRKTKAADQPAHKAAPKNVKAASAETKAKSANGKEAATLSAKPQLEVVRSHLAAKQVRAKRTDRKALAKNQPAMG